MAKLNPIANPEQRLYVDNVFALRRTGHHAVMAWLRDCYKEKGLSVFHANSVFNEHLGWELHSPDPNPDALLATAALHNVLIANYEDVAYRDRAHSPVFNALHTEGGRSARDIVIVRDWFNMIASRLKYIDDARTIGRYTITAALDWPTVAERWIDHATVLTREAGTDLLAINYNRWFTDAEYRQELATSLGVQDANAALDVVPEFGLGSSFDGMNKNGSARSMNVLRRWQNLDKALLSEYLDAVGTDISAIEPINRQLFGFGYSEVIDSL